MKTAWNKDSRVIKIIKQADYLPKLKKNKDKKRRNLTKTAPMIN